MAQITEVTKIRRRILAELVKLTYAGELEKNNIIENLIDTTIHSNNPRYRCCVHKERAVLKDRIKLALAQPLEFGLAEALEHAINGHVADMPIINIMPEACDQCPIDKFLVTNACRNCVAHHCIASCPKKAISVIGNQAFIDKVKCVECGLCKKSCPYGAIVEINRPCEQACELSAIKSDKDRRAAIDYSRCVQCGKCKVACPFGAIGEQSFIVQLIEEIKAHKRVYAILAPAFVSQFGIQIKPSQIFTALKKMGFYRVMEASFGADIVTLEETKEFLERVPKKQSFLTTSCCPAYVDMVKKHLPDVESNLSTTVSPMIAAAKVIKSEDPEAVTVFIGPCIAKKVEAKNFPDLIDYVITFEEAAALFAGTETELSAIEESSFVTTASKDGNSFAKAGGVAQAVVAAAANLAPERRVKTHSAEGLHNCRTALTDMKNEQNDATLFEGMACTGGCIGGPGILADSRISGKFVEKFAESASYKIATENEKAVETANNFHDWHND